MAKYEGALCGVVRIGLNPVIEAASAEEAQQRFIDLLKQGDLSTLLLREARYSIIDQPDYEVEVQCVTLLPDNTPLTDLSEESADA